MTTTYPTQTQTPTGAEPTADEFAERIFSSTVATMELMSVYIGQQLGWYHALTTHGPLTSATLARSTGTDERYAREWLEQQAVFGILATDPSRPADERTYSLPAGAAEVLTDEHSLAYLGLIGGFAVAPARQMTDLLEAYRTGGGVGWDEFGEDARLTQAALNRPWFEHRLPADLATVPHVHEQLRAPGARIAEVGFGGGWASIALARAYPQARVDGYEIDGPSVEMARRNAAEAGVDDRVRFHLVDGADIPESGAFDAVFAFECIHDMAQPVEVLAAVRKAVKPDGAVIVMDEAVAPEFQAPGDDLERFMYGCSILVCLPDGRSHSPSEATGTVMRQSVLTGYARRAGYADVTVLPIEEFGFWRFYQLHLQ
jgi:SAM-dependent methyltransferase